ncbi:MAG: hypothetical protein WDO13_11190 [Verrucomicrobiota bacterium]
MLLKRIIVLGAGVLLCLIAFVVYFEVSHAQMEAAFRAERDKFHFDRPVLVSQRRQRAAPPPPAAPAATATG